MANRRKINGKFMNLENVEFDIECYSHLHQLENVNINLFLF